MENSNIFERIDKINYYLDIAETVASRGTCLRNNYGSVIVKNDEVISTGYTGSPRGRINCTDLKKCMRKEHNTPSGSGYELCRSVHSEQNAIISASREKMIDSTLYLVGINKRTNKYVLDNEPCTLCKRMIINSGVKTVVMRDTKTDFRTVLIDEWILNDDTL